MTVSNDGDGTGASVGPSTNGNGHDARRWPVAAFLIVLLVAAIVAGNGSGDAATRPVDERAADAVAISAGDARSAAWYCPGPPPSALLSEARERVLVSNLDASPVDVAVTVFGAKGAVARRSMSAPARAAAPVATEGREAENSAIVVEPFSSQAVVEATNTGPNLLTTAPCATQPSAVWNFAAGTTVRGVEDWVVLFNPFGDDAVVDMSFFTDGGFERPDKLQGLTIPRRSRVAVAVHQYVRRQQSVATTIAARTGRVVAQQTVVFGPDSNRSGETRSIGAVAPAQEWVFPSGRTAAGSVRTLALSNPGDLDAEVDVSVAPAADLAIEPATVQVPRRGVANVQIGACGALQPPDCIPVPPNVAYSMAVTATLDDVPVFADDLVTYTAGRFTGATGGIGSHEPARTWVFARSRVAHELDAGLDLLTVGNSPAKVDISFVHDGEVLAPDDLQGVELRPGVRLSIPLASRRDLRRVHDAAIVVRADRPIVAERTIVRDDELTRDLGIPSRD